VERWLKAGVMQQDGTLKATLTGTPQGGGHQSATGQHLLACGIRQLDGEEPSREAI